jgi:hypothetical protein
MSDPSNLQISQGLVVLPPRSDDAYPIPCEEWSNLKLRVSKLTSEPWLFHTMGSVFVGAALSTLVAIFVTPFQLPEQQRVVDISWAVLAVTAVCGAACMYFAHKERGVHRDRASDVVAQMELIEKRFDRVST